MTQAEAHQRVEKAQNLRVFKVNDTYFVESSEGKICYGVTLDADKGVVCTCGDYARNIKNDPNFRCKHITAAIQCNGGDLLTTEFLEKKKPRMDERFIKNIKGKDFALYAGVLDLAHKMGLVELKAIPVQYPTKENDMRAICVSYAKTVDGKVFEDVGDADPRNTDAVISKHIIRMASTRAKARVLRDLTNVGMACVEELGSFDEVVGIEQSDKTKEKSTETRGLRVVASNTGKAAKAAQPQAEAPQPQKEVAEAAPIVPPAPPVATAPPAIPNSTEQTTSEIPNTPTKQSPANGPRISEAQHRAILNLGKLRSLTKEDLAKRVQEQYKTPLDELSIEDASAFIKALRLAA
ncbi:MAG: hypothetical protein WCQ90_08710 [Deltaproteobacteria bacterium]